MADIEDIRARVAAASSGRWQRHGCDVWRDGDTTPFLRGRDDNAETRQQADADAEFVAHARQDLLDLLDMLRQPTGTEADAAEAAVARPSEDPLTSAPGPFTS